ncbi:MAG: methionyl-tRNA formyltransferase [Candidatus Pacebacteria bacterium]|nr:methionyl-tRNA formyltransferase [Candidatus Paceibacterota bacterium]MBP9842566.1 methionyl-tRNA formyltransferase [Candidatus Paceibacterota bacterium]
MAKSKKDLQYVIATTKSWNVANFEKYFSTQKNFHLITRNEDLTLEWLRKVQPRYIFFPHWSWIVPKEIWSEFECVTLHETDLPYGRGGSPIQNLIARGHKKTKISAIKIEAGIDTGDVYIKYPVSLHGSAQEIFERISDIVFSTIIPTLISKELVPKRQRGKDTVFKRRTPDMSRISGKEKPAELYDLIRMVDADSYPHAFLELENQRFEFSEAKLVKGTLYAKVTITNYPKK